MIDSHDNLIHRNDDFKSEINDFSDLERISNTSSSTSNNMRPYGEQSGPPGFASQQSAPPGYANQFNNNNNSNNEDSGWGRIDRYVLLDKLGESDLGYAFKARDMVANLIVTVKIIPRRISSSPADMEKLRTSFSIAARLQHPNIANVHYLHKVETADPIAAGKLKLRVDDLIIVQEYVDGVSLNEWCQQYENGMVPLDNALELLTKIAEVMEYIHKRKIFHGELKPNNILIGMDGEIKVMDVLIAEKIRFILSEGHQNAIGDIVETGPFISPEQWQGMEPDSSSDQYAMGAVFYYMISGRAPFASVFSTGNPVLAKNVVCNQELTYPKSFTRKQVKVLKKGLNVDPGSRYGSCSTFIESLGGKVQKTNSVRVGGITKQKSFKVVLFIFVFMILAAIGGYFAYKFQLEKSHERHLSGFDKDKRNRLRKLYDDAKTFSDAGSYVLAMRTIDELLWEDPNNQAALELRKKIGMNLTLADVTTVKVKLDSTWAKIKLLDRGQGVGRLMDNADLKIREGNTFFDKSVYGDALSAYLSALAILEQIQDIELKRDSIRKLIAVVNEKRSIAEDALAPIHAPEIWASAVIEEKNARKKYEARIFDESISSWTKAEELYIRSSRAAHGAQNVAGVKSRYDDALKSYPLDKLSRFGGDSWNALEKLQEKAVKAESEANWADAVDIWQEAIVQLEKTKAEAISKENKILYEQAVKEGDEALAQQRWQDAKKTFEVALGIPGYHNDSHLLNGIKKAKVGLAVLGAEFAVNKLLWDELLICAERILNVEPDNKKALEWRKTAQGHLNYRLTVKTFLNGKEVKGGVILINDKNSGFTTPAELILPPNINHVITVRYGIPGRSFKDEIARFGGVRDSKDTFKVNLVENVVDNNAWIEFHTAIPDILIDDWMGKIWLREAKVKTNGDINLYFKAMKSGYACIVDVAPNGEMRILFPNYRERSPEIRAGETYQIPGPGEIYKIKAGANEGIHALKMIVTKNPLDLGIMSIRGFKSIDRSAQKNFIESITRQLDEMRNGDWSSCSAFLEIKD